MELPQHMAQLAALLTACHWQMLNVSILFIYICIQRVKQASLTSTSGYVSEASVSTCIKQVYF